MATDNEHNNNNNEKVLSRIICAEGDDSALMFAYDMTVAHTKDGRYDSRDTLFCHICCFRFTSLLSAVLRAADFFLLFFFFWGLL